MIGSSFMKELIESYINTYIKPISRRYQNLLVKRLCYIGWMAADISLSWLELLELDWNWSYY